ncbi:MAG: class I SAM-dependent methyltransferase [Rhodospirillales bacterium]|nr:class I SAM-dependent methyltransferase [Rhodospirillales bacterium]
MDFGAGVNYITPYFLKSGNEVVAVDICEESIRYQRKILAQLSVPIDKLTSVVADVEKTEYEEVFDVVNVSNMLHHVADKKAALEKIYKSLKPGGKMIIVEPNYYYPPRWMIETDFLDSINFVKKYFVRNDLIEQDEKAVVFRELVAIIEDAGFRIDFREKDRNYLGYFTVYWMGEGTISARIIYWLDQNILSRLLPRIFAPFEYLIATKR